MPDDERVFATGGQDSRKLGLEHIRIAAAVRSSVRYEGHSWLETEDYYGADYMPVLSWSMNLLIQDTGSLYELWTEIECDESVTYQLRLGKWQAGAADVLLDLQSVDGPLAEPVVLKKDFNGYLSVDLWAKGSGRIRVGALHYRELAGTVGTFLPGDVRHADAGGEEFFSYLDVMDRKPPLNVYFSGYRTLEGFEGWRMMRSMGAPFLLLTDPRLEGGKFYLGSGEYETSLEQTIRNALSELGFTEQQLILSGMSMGTYGAMYYSAPLRPHAVVIGKPLMNAGTIAADERILRSGGFPTSLDVLMNLEGDTTDEAVEQLNHRMWDRFDRTDFRNTKFAISYMEQDDYDPKAYEDILLHLKDKRVQIYGKGLIGRHNDNTEGIVQWFKSQYRRILQEDFGRDSAGEQVQ